ncbi:hypothetical protein GCM10009839_72270 [Catenulispora yoronensis]|uniref:WXG100 family type VII secretion target n=1 Tax=Catenulispora yoronensis TaxID=450799 RepID=A0ABN2V6T4_9ACTN
MGDQLQVDYDGLENFSDALGNAQIAFDSSGQSATDYTGRMGAKNVEDALHDFVQRWSTGRATIDSYFDALTKMVDGSIAELKKMDKHLADSSPTG